MTTLDPISIEDPTAVPLPKSPYMHATTDSLSTGSLFSVRLSDRLSGRLSDPLAAAAPLDESSSSLSTDSDATVHPVSHSKHPSRSSAEIMSGAIDLESELDASDALDFAPEHPQEDLAISRHSTSTAHLSLSTVQADDSVADMESLHRVRSDSMSSQDSRDSEPVDWKQLDKSEESEPRNEESDEVCIPPRLHPTRLIAHQSTAFLLARLEQENNALAADTKFGIATPDRKRSQKHARPPSLQVLKKLVSDPNSPSLRYSVLPEPPPMTELEFWAALVKDYKQTAQRLPTLTTNKIKAGVPPPLRGVVWMSMVGARENDLASMFDKLIQETSPYDTIIGKDIGRSFPGVDMFKDVGGEGQQSLARVLKAFSLYDKEIGYCQGMGFLVGPLLMQMPDRDAFCVLVKLMDNFDLRTCFQPDLSGLHLRTFQFQRLLEHDMPKLAEHLKQLQVEAAYLSQWFLSFFAVTCPLPMLFRIYDVIFAEGASETIMRVALSLMKRNEEKLMSGTEFEDVMQLLLGRSLWDPYGLNADELVNDFMSMTGLVTRDSLSKLEVAFKHAQAGGVPAARSGWTDVSHAAGNFLGRLWTTKPANSSLSPGGHARSPSQMRRTASKQSLASTVTSSNEHTSGDSHSIGTAATDMTSRDSSADALSIHSKAESTRQTFRTGESTRELHSQIEELLTALTVSQKQTADLVEELQREREARSEDQHLMIELVDRLKFDVNTSSTTADKRRTLASAPDLSAPSQALSDHLTDVVERVDRRLAEHSDFRRAVTVEHKQRLRDSLIRSKDRLGSEMVRAADLSRKLDMTEKENLGLRDELREARARVQEGFSDRQRLERTIADLRRQSYSSYSDESSPTWQPQARLSMSSLPSPGSHTSGGLRELKLGRRDSMKPSPVGTASYHPPRGSSLATKAILATEDHKPAHDDALLLELVQAKTAEASARQELEELKGRMESMRKMLNLPVMTPTAPRHPSPLNTTTAGSGLSNMLASAGGYFNSAHKPSTSEVTVTPPLPSASDSKPADASALSTAAGGFWSWGKRSTSSSTAPPSQAAAGSEAKK